MMEALLAFDEQALALINGRWHTDWLDWLMPWWRDKHTWIPLYLVLTAWLLWRYKKPGLYLLFGAVITVALSDTLSHRVIKAQVQRDRPCREAALQTPVRVLVSCGGGYSFTSNHAANHVALAFFLSLSVFRKRKWLSAGFMFWAFSIGYGQIYVGVHYPLDVIGGSFLGILCAFMVWRITQKYVSLQKIST